MFVYLFGIKLVQKVIRAYIFLQKLRSRFRKIVNNQIFPSHNSKISSILFKFFTLLLFLLRFSYSYNWKVIIIWKRTCSYVYQHWLSTNWWKQIEFYKVVIFVLVIFLFSLFNVQTLRGETIVDATTQLLKPTTSIVAIFSGPLSRRCRLFDKSHCHLTREL